MIRVAVSGCMGRMGTEVVNAVEASDDMEIACGIDPGADESAQYGFPVYSDISSALKNSQFDVLVDFTRPDAVAANVAAALSAGIDCVVGTTGLDQAQLEELASKAECGAGLFYAPNFTTGAVLMMQFAKAAAPYFPDAEIIEMHHCNKLDAPSGTAMQTARVISEGRDGVPGTAPGRETEREDAEGARGACVDGVYVHSVRTNGHVASQEVVFGSFGQTLSIRHDSWDRGSYMAGVLLGIRSVGGLSGLVVGLENIM